MYCVYEHRRLSTGKTFYIGKGLKYRPFDTVGRSKYWKNIVKKEGGLIIAIVVDGLTEEDSFDIERQLIRFYDRKNLVNFTDGGEGCSGRIRSEETKKKHAESMRLLFINEPWRRAEVSEKAKRPMSEEQKIILSQQKKGVAFSEEHRKNLSLAKLGKAQSPELIRARTQPNVGKKRTAETKAQMSAWQKGKPKSEEHKLSMSIAAKNRSKKIA